MKILVITQYFYPENFRINNLCIELKKRGHHITVLTGIPNYPEGKYFEGYGVFKNRRQIWEDMQIIRVPLFPRLKGKIPMVLNYFSFALFGSVWSRFFCKESYDIIYVFEVSPMTVCFPAIALKKKTSTKIIMNVQDLWPENIQAVTGLNNKFILRMIGKMVDYIYKNCDLILTASKSFLVNIVNRGHSSDKVEFWPQYADNIESSITNDFEIEKEFTGNFNIVFTGNIGFAQGLDVVVNACELLKDHTDMKWHFVGDGRARESLVKLAEERGVLGLMKFWGRRLESEMPLFLKNADAALIVLKKDKIFEMTIPAKLQTYMAFSCPLISCADGEVSDIINSAQCGLTANAGDYNKLAQITMELKGRSEEELFKMGDNAYQYLQENFNKKVLLDKLIDCFERLR